MKKLLVILLLLFPVHGAWAEDLHLICIAKSMTFEVEWKGKKQNETSTVPPDQQTFRYKLKLDGDRINEQGFVYKITNEFIDFRTRLKSNVIKYNEIDRITGEWKLYISKFTTQSKAIEYFTKSEKLPILGYMVGSCEKTSGKKKF